MSAHICCSCGTEHEPLLPTAPGAAMCPQCKRQAAILLAGAYELVHRRDVPPRVVINEYVEIAHAFYDQGEPSFINSVLDRVARQVRPAELVK